MKHIQKQIVMLLDDYNTLFKQLPTPLAEAFAKTALNITNFDLKGFEHLKNIVKGLLSDLGDYEICSYISGTEAIDKSILWVRHFNQLNSVVKFGSVYHGDTLLLHEKKMHQASFAYHVLTFHKDNEQATIEEVSELKDSILLLEPFFGDYGYQYCHSFYHAVAEICKKNRNVLLMDEIRSGMYHSGRFLFCQKLGIAPDVICISKGLASGVPLSLVCFKRNSFLVKDWKEIETHRTSQSVNSCSIQRAIHLLQFFGTANIQKELVNAQETLEKTFDSLKNNPLIARLTISGFIVMIHTDKNKIRLTHLIRIFQYLISKGIQCRFPEKGVFILVFPFDVTAEDARTVVECFQTVLGNVCC